jgi:hypothetical protein
MTRVLLTLAALGLCAGCAAQKPLIRTRLVNLEAGPAAAAPLTRSLFKKPQDRENLDEDVIQRVIGAPLQPEFPARAGVLVLDAPFTRKAYAALTPGDRAPQILARRLERDRHFVMVSDISPHLVKGQGIEAIRELAARYRLRYLVIFNRRFDDRRRVNRWGWSWISLVAIPFAPAYTYRTTGLLEATLMDVRTGTFLFTTQVHIEATQRATPWSGDDKLAAMELEAAQEAALKLSSKFLAKCRRLVSYARVEGGARVKKSEQRDRSGSPSADKQAKAKEQDEQGAAGRGG